MAKRIGILTGGGDCPGLNAVIRAVITHAHGNYGWDTVGVCDGFKGLYEEQYMELDPARTRSLLTRGGTILGSSNYANPFAYPVKLPDGRVEIHDVSTTCLRNLARLELEGLIVVGGDGTQSFGHKFGEAGAKLVGVPKTIDNDLEATEYTIGFQTAIEVVTEAIDRLQTTAESHDRIMICEVMGRYAGWIALNAGMAGGADVVLIPEIEYDPERVVKAIHRRHGRGVSYTVVVVAEGARSKGGDYAVMREGDVTRQEKLGGAGQRLAREICELTDYDVRVTVLGHLQRGGTPCAFDRLLATRFGVKAVDLVARGEFGQVTALVGTEVVAKPIDTAVKKLKLVNPRGDLVAAARALGIELGA